jgi:hypothetical protein
MTDRRLVRGEIDSQLTVVRIAAPLLAIVGAILMFTLHPIGGGVVLASGAILTVYAEITAFIKRRQRTWIEVLPDGFVVEDRHGKHTYRDYDVRSIAYSRRDFLSNGQITGYSRRCEFWFSEGPNVVMEEQFLLAIMDPMAVLIDRILALLRDGYARALEHGAAIEGDGWHATKEQFHYQRAGTKKSIYVNEIAAIEYRDGFMQVWMHGQSEPAVKLSPDGRNTWLLPGLLKPYLSPRRENAQSADGLGRILFRRTSTRGAFLGSLAVSLACGIGGVVTWRNGGQDGDAIIPAFFLFAIAAGFLLVTWHCLVSRCTCYERGVSVFGFFGGRRLRYEALIGFAYQAIRLYHNLSYVSTRVTMRFVPDRGEAVVFTASSDGQDYDLEILRDQISKIIAEKLLQELAARNEVRWTDRLTINKHGVVLTAISAEESPTVLRFQEYQSHKFKEGNLLVYSKSQAAPAFSTSTSHLNLFPGLYVFLSLVPSTGEKASALAGTGENAP